MHVVAVQVHLYAILWNIDEISHIYHEQVYHEALYKH
jgi:hypothetical protein